MAKYEIRPGYWRIVVSAGKDPVTGKYRQISQRFTGTERQAEKKEALLLAQAQAPQITRGTVGYTLDYFLTHRRDHKRLAPSTLYGYERRIEAMKALVGTVALEDFDVEAVDALYSSLTTDERKNLDQYHAILRAALNLARRNGWITVNPCELTTAPANEDFEINLPTPAEVDKLILAATEWNREFGVFLRLAADTGARPGELCALRVSDLDPTEMVVTINRAVSVVPGRKAFVKQPKTKKSGRRIPIGEGTAAVLLDYLAYKGQIAQSLEHRLLDDFYLFSKDIEGEHHAAPDTMGGRFERVRAKVGLTCRLYDLRHFFATQQLAAGMDVTTVSYLMGHASVTMTLNVYSHYLPAKGRESVDLVARLREAWTRESAPKGALSEQDGATKHRQP